MSVTSQSERDAAIRQSKTNLRSSLENPIKEVDELIEKPEVARNTEDAKEVSEYYDEEEEEYYDEEEENENSHSQSHQSRESRRSQTSANRLNRKLKSSGGAIGTGIRPSGAAGGRQPSAK